ncbi:TPA: JAB domain-containing protein [candidate division WWE3 bacterium]|uniref:JAB domain-containing protein n=1 Tax=candidate division WWE3 bacterium TaxID=2053526 RepID=A0A656PNC4_UNCKA|nr:DNA repair protein RadC [candidate division WWE3 bacterium RAAC2_WWE3_1]OGC68131.1 MAG: hypothetical protein A2364_03135 [candidate division WWE3 bacterium RIFOXYB1_FULL_43_12]HAI95257.1 JAB domain-containing protein [candidate division WWE3 bacterium]HBL00727.1 JAB domain-containing protein [candidate division WWE3 bacterium]HBT66409.1 JAB domain-containing protein [candidate division WWE3 bacterium]
MNILSLPREDRPREKLLNSGADTMSDAELIALILSSGGKGQSVLELSQSLIKEAGKLTELLNSPIQKLVKHKNLGEAKAIKLAAVKELARRYNNKNRAIIRISTPGDAYDYIKPSLLGKETEHLYLITLNARNTVINRSLISVGTVNETLIHPREIIKVAVTNNAVSIILVHNHPSGEPYPSAEDIKVTQRLENACRIVGVGFTDHLIVCDNSYSSMRAQNLLGGGEKN